MANVIGERVRRREDPRFLTGAGLYVDDVQLPGAKRVTFVRSDWAHAKILGIDTSAADEIPGTRALTAADVDLPTNPLPPFLGIDERMQRPFLASDTVRFVGDIVAIVVSDGRELGVDAAELVDVEYDALPVVTNLRDAARDEGLLFPDVGTNVCMRQAPESPDEHLFDDCELVTSGTAGILGLEPERVRVIAPDVGGGFGGKGLAAEDVLLAWVARAAGEPVRWTETRSENLVAMHQGRAQEIDFEIGGDRDGQIKALRLKILQDGGAYPGLGAFLARLT